MTLGQAPFVHCTPASRVVFGPGCIGALHAIGLFVTALPAVETALHAPHALPHSRRSA